MDAGCWKIVLRGLLDYARSGYTFGKVVEEVICVAPAPVLSRFYGAHHRVPGRAKMRGRVLVPRRIAAAHMTAGEADSEMHPRVSSFDAILTLVAFGREIAGGSQMFAAIHRALLPWQSESVAVPECEYRPASIPL